MGADGLIAALEVAGRKFTYTGGKVGHRIECYTPEDQLMDP